MVDIRLGIWMHLQFFFVLFCGSLFPNIRRMKEIVAEETRFVQIVA